MRIPEIDPEIVERSRKMMAAKSEREKKAARRKWWSENWSNLAWMAITAIGIVVSAVIALQ